MTVACPLQHHEPDPWKHGETDREYVGLCRYDLAAPESHHAPHAAIDKFARRVARARCGDERAFDLLGDEADETVPA